MEARAGQTESNPALVEALRARIERQGRITFAEFMEAALFDPEHGYYLTHAVRAGRTGDFLTAPETHPLFGRAIARQIDEFWQALGRPSAFTLREYGAGSGALGLAILSALHVDRSGLAEAIRYEPVEVNPARLAELRRWFDEAGLADALAEPEPGERIVGCVLANEFVDAFPVHRVEMRGGELREVYVVWRDGWFAEELGEPSTPDLAAYFDREGIALAEGQRAEVNLAAPAWVHEVAGVLARGYALVIDYGYPAAELYGPERARGTLKAYFRHTVHEDPYQAVGNQDLTAHVDFTALQLAAREHGLQVLGFTRQADFLAGCGIGEFLVEMQRREGTTAEAYLAARAAVIRLIDPGGMGRFGVLILGRDVDPARPLAGLSARV